MTHRSVEHLTCFAKQYPSAWKQADEMRADKGNSLPDWPDWCFLPLAGWYAIISMHLQKQSLNAAEAGDVSKLGAIGAWRAGQGIYRFHDAIRDSIMKSPVSGNIPCDVLRRMPEWAVYIETPKREVFGKAAHGFWAHLESDANTGREELRILVDYDENLLPLILHIGPWTVVEAVERFVATAGQHTTDLGIAEYANAIQPLLSLLLYLCSEEPEVTEQNGDLTFPTRPAATKTKRGWRLFPPSKPKIWNVGESTGTALLKLARASAKEKGAGPTPHIRRAHWHGYWTGPKNNQKFIYKWLPPIPVAMPNDDNEGLKS